MTRSVTYQRETKSVPFQGKTIVLESLTPVLSPKEKAQRKKEIEHSHTNGGMCPQSSSIFLSGQKWVHAVEV